MAAQAVSAMMLLSKPVLSRYTLLTSVVVQTREFEHILIDVDDCIYRIHEIPVNVYNNITGYMRDKLGVPHEEVQELARQLYHGYGTTMAGLMAAGYSVDVDDWHAAVHDTLAYEQLLQEDPQLREVLARLTLQKHVLTNADARHAVKVFKQLGVSDCFQNVFCYENVQELGLQAGIVNEQNPVLCKPSKHVYQLVMQQVGAQPHNTIFIDDSPRNIAAAHELGIFTVLVSDSPGGPPGHPHHVPGADLVVSHFRELPEVLPEIFSSPAVQQPHEDVLAGVPIKVTAS